MNMNYKNLILTRLLDKYEKSKFYLDKNKLNRRILLKLNSSEFPEYDIENTEVKEHINSVIDELYRNGFIEYEWLKHEENNIIDKIWPVIDRIDEIYKDTERVPKKTKVNNVIIMLKEARENISELWIRKFLEDTELSIESKRSITPFLPDDLEIIKALLVSLKVIDNKGDEEYLERVFSLKCFNDSKFFEKNLKKRLIDIIKKYFSSEDAEGYTDEEILAQINIVKAPEQIDFCGNVTGIIEGRQINFSLFKKGITINSPTARELELIEVTSTDRILFIENKANYIDYILKKREKNELVIFHGGFYSPLKGLFFKKIYDACAGQNVEFYHWGDIDAGGFKMFTRLKSNIIGELKPYLMDREAFISKRNYWMTFDKNYGCSLKEMLKKEEFREFHNVIELMVQEKARLEQEAFLV